MTVSDIQVDSDEVGSSRSDVVNGAPTREASSQHSWTGSIEPLVHRLQRTRDRAAAWLLARIGNDGTPAHGDQPTAWGRIPWALTLTGQPEAAAAVLGWAVRSAIAEDGGFKIQASKSMPMAAYPLAHLAIGSWLLERYDVSLAIIDRLRTLRDMQTGGISTGFVGPGGGAVQDLLVTAQVGVAALITGQDDLIDHAYRWIDKLHADQPELPHRLYTMREGEAMLTELDRAIAWAGKVDFRLPRQAFYHPGMAAAFLAGYAMRRADSSASALAWSYLSLSAYGTDMQFSDKDSVQICKFGWGASTLLLADPTRECLPYVVRMAEWFIARQDEDGGWSPSRFMVPQPTDANRMAKTAEHAMEVNVILNALGTARARANA